MNEIPDTELLSAYLDGELSADGRARVEQLLAADPAARQTMDELRALSAKIRGLPQQKLGEDLSQIVLRSAERRMLTESRGRPTPVDSIEAPTWRGPTWRGMLGKRALVWSGLAAAIALMIVWSESPRPARQIAVAPQVNETVKDTRPAGPPPTIQAPANEIAAAKVEPQPKQQLVLPAKDAAPAAKPAGGSALPEQLAASPAPAPARAALTDHDKVAQKEAGRKAPEPNRKVADRKAVEEKSGEKVEEKLAYKGAPAKKSGAAMGTAGGGGMAMKTPSDAPLHQNVDGFAGQQMQVMARVDQQAAQIAPPAAPAATAPPPAPAGHGLAKAAKLRDASSFAEAGQGGGAIVEGSVIRANISFEAARNRTFEQLLAANGISIHSRVRQSETADWLEESQKTAADAGDKTLGDREARAKRPADDSRRSGRQSLLVYEVDATPAQIESLLKQLADKSEAFSSVAVNGPSARKAKMEAAAPEQLAASEPMARRNLQYQSRSRASAPAAPQEAAPSKADSAAIALDAKDGANALAPQQPAFGAAGSPALKRQLEVAKENAAPEKPAGQRIVFMLRVLDRAAANAAAPMPPAAAKP